MLVIKGVSLRVRYLGHTLKFTSSVILGILFNSLSLSVCSFVMGVVTPTYRGVMQIHPGARWEAWSLAYGKHSVNGGCYYCGLVI